MARRKREPRWTKWSDERLLSLRVCDLGIELPGSQVEEEVRELYRELELKGINFRPHLWLSEEWFTPNHVPGIAVPFYLAHPRLRELERSQMLEVEGGTHDWCMRILRHEAGHALDHAYRLHLRKRYKELFGSYFDPYPESYRPRPYSKAFVVHLDMWYAQAHPAEDFAETFAVWLNPRRSWREEFKGWAALRKLEYVDDVMREVSALRASVRTRRRTHPMRSLTTTLAQHYEKKRAYYVREHPGIYDRDLRRLFSAEAKYAERPEAGAFLEGIRAEARTMVSRWTGESPLTIDQTFADLKKRVRRLKLRLCKSEEETRKDVMLMLAVQTMNFLNDGRHRVVL